MEQKQRVKILEKLAKEGVEFISTDGVVISAEADIEPGVVIYPGTIIEGMTKIGGGSIIGPDAMIVECSVGVGVRINASQCFHSKIGNGTHVGPYAHIRPDCDIGEGVKIGAFVEIKNSVIGNDCSMAHLCYIGDADVGNSVNFGCGTVIANYDGLRKHRTGIGAGAFIGCNSNLIAPLNIGAGAYIAAGSSLSEDVPAGALAISRQRPEIKEGWADKFRNS